MRIFLKTILLLFVFTVAMALWSFGIEPSRITYRHHDIHLPQWPQELSGLTIAFITDIHVGSPHITVEKLETIVKETNAQKPDIILLGGDYVIQGVLGGTPVPFKDIALTLSKLNAPYGVFGILGNHDWWDNEVRIRNEFKTHAIPMLEDEAHRITLGKTDLWLVGISDYNEGPHDMKKALSTVTSDIPIIVLTHSPDIFPELPSTIALTLAGHTHGDQVYIPFIGRPVVPSKYGQRYAMGLIKEGNKQLFVSPGIGTSMIPIRFMTPPEVSFLHIYPNTSSSHHSPL